MYEPINPRLRLILLGLGLISILGVGIWISPRGLSIYYQTRGGQLLEDVFKSDGTLVDGIACEKPPLTNKDSLTKVTQVISDLQKAIQYNAINSMAYLQLGRAYCLIGDPELAIEFYLNYLNLHPDNPLGHLELGFAYEAVCRRNMFTEEQESMSLADHKLCSDQGLLSAALRNWQLSANPNDFVEAGNDVLSTGHYKEAIEWYQRSSELGIDLDSSIWYTSALEHRNNGEVHLYSLDLERSIIEDEGWTNPETRFLAWYYWGLFAMEQTQYKKAEAILQKTIQLYPNRPYLQATISEAYRLLGGAQWNSGNLEQAKRNLEKAIELNNDNTWAHIHYGKVLYLYDRGLVSKTEEEFNYVLSQNPNRVEIWGNLIAFWRWVGEVDRANRLCSRAEEAGIVTGLENECPTK